MQMHHPLCLTHAISKNEIQEMIRALQSHIKIHSNQDVVWQITAAYVSKLGIQS